MNNVGGQWKRAGDSGLFVLDHIESYVILGTSKSVVLDADPDRIAISFDTGGGYTIYVSINGINSLGSAFTISSGNRPIIINDLTMPGMASRQWVGYASAAGSTLSYAYVRVIR